MHAGDSRWAGLEPEVPEQLAPDVFGPHGFISLECSHFGTCSGLIRKVMAIQRKGKEGRTNGDSVHEEKTSELTERRKLRKTLKDQQQREQKKWDVLRWVLVVIVLALAIVGLYYYFTYYRPNLPTMKTKSKTEAGREEAKSRGKVTKSKGSKEKGATPSKDGKTGKTAESSSVKSGGGGSKSKGSSAKRKSSKSTAKGGTDGSESATKTPRSGDDLKAAEDINLNDIPLLKRPIPPSDSDRPYIIEILTATTLLEDKKYWEALERFNSILKTFKQSPRALYGKAVTLYYMAMEKRSNELLDTSIDFFSQVGIESFLTPEDIRISALLQLSNLARKHAKPQLSVKALEKLCSVKSDNSSYANMLGVGYLVAGQNRKAKAQFKKVLKKSPDNYYAKAHIGFVLYSEKQFEEALPLLLEGLKNDPDIKTNPRFYLSAGESLMRLNRSDEALVLYGEAVSRDLFPSVWQRSLYNEPGLRAMPWWGVGETGYQEELMRIVNALENITSEALSALDHDRSFPGHTHHLYLFSNGKKDATNCKKAPITCALIETFPEAAGCRRGEVRFSVMPPHGHVLPFVGLTNVRLQAVLGLDVAEELRIRVAEEERFLSEGKLLVIDDSFEQELWYRGSQPAVMLSIHMWHPDLSKAQQRTLGPI